MCQKSGSLTSFQRRCDRATFHRNDGLASRWNFRLDVQRPISLALATDLNPIANPEIALRFRLIYTTKSISKNIFFILYQITSMNFSTKLMIFRFYPINQYT